MISRWRAGLDLLERYAKALENGVLVLLLSVLVICASSQIILRNVFSASLAWGDELVRLLVLWLALIGAIAASRDGRQIRIDVLARLLPQRLVWIPESIAMAFTAVVCGLLSWQSVRFVQDSKAFSDLVLGSLPAWLLQLILPIGFGIMAYRYAIGTAVTLSRRQ